MELWKNLTRNIFKFDIDIKLTEEQIYNINKDIAILNLYRFRIGAAITFVMELFILFFHDLPQLSNALEKNRWIYEGYLYLHLALAMLCSFSFIILHRAICKNKFEPINFYEKLIYFVVGVFLLILTFISGLDQITTGQVLVFGLNILLSALVIIIKPSYGNVIYIAAYIIYLVVMLIFQNNSELLFSNIVNGSFFFVSALFTSKFMYNNQFMQLGKNMQLQEINKRLEHLSHYDILTEIPNRRFFMEQLNSMNTDEKSISSAIIILDIDHFKNINDKYGHPAGDYILKQVAALIRNNISAKDIVARFGGEEFLVMLKDTNLEKAELIGDNLRKTIEKYNFIFEECSIKLTSSLGIAKLKNPPIDFFDKAYSLADKALYESKQGGRNKVSVIWE